MGMAPLFVKYRTQSGSHYVYDACTNEILRVGEVIYELLDDFCVFDTVGLMEKHPRFNEEAIREAVRQFEGLQSQGVLCSHAPERSFGASQVRCQNREQSFGEFLQEHSRLLTLELTHDCNLRCEYCCYGEHYPKWRPYDKVAMSLETAKAAIRAYLSRRPVKCRVGFYGGEPLLEVELIKQIVVFAEDCAAQCGIEAEFNMTTNGTLLTDETIHFLAEHQFNVLISLDGPKEVHDRYRVFRSAQNPAHKSGSFDVVMKGVRRFAELYPDYPSRGIMVTLTATSDIEAVERFLTPLASSYSLVMSNIVSDVPDGSNGFEDGGNFRCGCWMVPACEGGDCRRERRASEPNLDDRGPPISFGAGPATPKPISRPDFCNWNAESVHRYMSVTNCFHRELAENPDVTGRYTNYPIARSLFVGNVRNLHHRDVTSRPLPASFVYRCLPGTTRTFCSAEGKLYCCERTETGEVFQLGMADRGVDTDRALRLAELGRLLSDCANCVAKRVCSLCASAMTEDKKSGKVDAQAYQKLCQSVVHNLSARLREYTDLMEVCQNQKTADTLMPRGHDDDWLDDLKYLLNEEHVRAFAQPEVEELTELVCGQ